MKLFRKVTAAALAAIMAVGAAPFSASAAEVKVPVNEATKYVDNLGAIWNLGNCFDASDCTWLSNEMDYETAWCGAKVTEKLIKAIKDMGFDTIRIPATWHNHVDGSYNISEQWMDRVEEVVEWSVDEGLYVILNYCSNNPYSIFFFIIGPPYKLPFSKLLVYHNFLYFSTNLQCRCN